MDGWVCAICGDVHDELPAVAMATPLCWASASETERQTEFELNSDVCIWKDQFFFVRGCLDVPMTDRAGEVFSFGVWVSLSRANFARYIEAYGDPLRGQSAPLFGWLANRLPGYPDTLNLPSQVQMRDAGLRPSILLNVSEHPLVAQQRTGIPFAEAAAYVHEHLGI